MFTQIKTKIIVALLVLFVFTFNVTGVIAAAPLALHIEVDQITNLPIPPAEFNATGLAVDSGFICGHGTVYELPDSSAHGKPEKSGILILNVNKHFVCENNEENTFDINMIVHLDTTTGNTTANWRIVGGTGDYVKIKGTGSLVGTPSPDHVYDVYDGKVH